MTGTARNGPLSLAARSVAGTVSALALVGGLVVATPPAQAGETVSPTATTAQSGYLDRTFAGGAGYRSIPKPQNAWRGAWGVGLAVSPSGLIRTLSRHDLAVPGVGTGYDRALLRSWTSSGWIDQGFWGGKAKDMGPNSFETGIGFLTATANDSISLVESDSYGCPPGLASRLSRNGRVVVTAELPTRGDDFDCRWDALFKPDGSFITCTSALSGESEVASSNTAFKVTDTRVLNGFYGCGLTLAGSHLWVTDRDSGKIARTSLTGVPDTLWGGDGYITTTLSGGSMGAQGLIDGTLYVVGDKALGTSQQLGVARFTPSGEPDPAFGNAGFASIGGNGAILRGRTVDVERLNVGPKGPVLSLRVSDPGVKNSTRYRLIRINKTGKLDLTFGSSGIIQTTTPTTAIAHDARGRILTLNYSATGTVTLARRTG